LLAAALGLAAAALLTATAVSVVFAVTKAHDNAELTRAFQESKEQYEDRLRAEREKLREERERRRFESLSAQLALDRGVDLCERKRPGEGTLWFTRALEMAPHDARVQETGRRLLAGWLGAQGELELMLPHPQSVSAVAWAPDGATLLTACD